MNRLRQISPEEGRKTIDYLQCHKFPDRVHWRESAPHKAISGGSALRLKFNLRLPPTRCES